MNDFFEFVRRFLLVYLPKQRCFSKNTIKSYKQTLNLFIKYMKVIKSVPVAKLSFACIDQDAILDFLEWLETTRQCSANTRNQRLMALRSFFQYAGINDCEQTALYLRICDIPKKQTHGKVVDFLSETAYSALLQQPSLTKAKGLRDLFFLTLMYDTAARCSELLDMKICDLRIDTRYPIAYLHGKGHKTRTVPLLEDTVKQCKVYLRKFHPDEDKQSDAPLFYTIIHGMKQNISTDTIASFLSKYAHMAKATCPEMPERIHPHMIRHTRAMHLYKKGLPLDLLSQFLGHSQIETTLIYAYADTEMKRKAIQKADIVRKIRSVPDEIWANNEAMILKLSGLT